MRPCRRDFGVWRRCFRRGSGPPPEPRLISRSSWLRRCTDFPGQLCGLGPPPLWSWFFLLSLRQKSCKWSNSSSCSSGRYFWGLTQGCQEECQGLYLHFLERSRLLLQNLSWWEDFEIELCLNCWLFGLIFFFNFGASIYFNLVGTLSLSHGETPVVPAPFIMLTYFLVSVDARVQPCGRLFHVIPLVNCSYRSSHVPLVGKK